MEGDANSRQPADAGAGADGPGAAPATAADRSVLLALRRGTSQISWLLEGDGRIRWVSPAVTRTLGYEPQEVVGTDVLGHVHPDDVQIARALLAFAASHPADGAFEYEGVDLSFDVRIRHRDGRWVLTENLANNLLATPEVHGILVVSREAAGRRALDDALTALAQDGASDEALLRLLAFVEIQVARSAVDTALYWPRGEPPWITRRLPPELLGPEGPWVATSHRGIHVILDDLEAAVRERVLPPRLGRDAAACGYVACWCFPVPAPPHPSAGYSYAPGLPHGDRDPLGTLVVWSRRYRYPPVGHWGLTERVTGLAHLALSRRVADLERQSHLRREQEQVRRLQELDAMKTDLVLSVSHELRTPLTSILSFTELLAEHRQDPRQEQAEYVSIIQRNARRLLRMVEDLLFLGRLDARTVSVVPVPVDLPELVASGVETVGGTAEGRGVEVELVSAAGPPLHGDPERLRQLVDNLLSNAVKYTGAGGRVRAEVRPTATGWRLAVSDDGIGVPARDRERIFERFVRGSNARRTQIRGTGLGLAIARAVAELHHGTIELVDTGGPGSTFVATLRDP